MACSTSQHFKLLFQEIYTDIKKGEDIISKKGEDSPAQHIADDFFGWIGYTMRIILCFFERHSLLIVSPKKLFGRA